jgi:hypothetical protein
MTLQSPSRQSISQSCWAGSRSRPRLRNVFDVVVATLAYCGRHVVPLFVVAWLPCLIESVTRFTLEWLSVSAAMPQWLLAQDFDPPTWLTAFMVTPWAAMAWAFVLSAMADRSSKCGMIEISGTIFYGARLEFSPAVLGAAAIFAATNLVDAALRFAERSVPMFLLGDAGLSDLGFEIWGVSIVAVHIVIMAAAMAWSYPAAGLVLLTRHARARRGHPRLSSNAIKDVDGRDKPGHDNQKGHAFRSWLFEIDAALRLLRGNVAQITAIFILLTLALVALDRILDVPKTWPLRLLASDSPWNVRDATIRYALDFPLSMVMIVVWPVAVGIMLERLTPQVPAARRKAPS